MSKTFVLVLSQTLIYESVFQNPINYSIFCSIKILFESYEKKLIKRLNF